MANNIKLDRRGMSDLMKSDAVAKLVEGVAEAVAQNVRDQGIQVEGIPGDVELPVTVRSYTTDRAAASVALAHPSGVAVQAKHGSLTRAASEERLQVRG